MKATSAAAARRPAAISAPPDIGDLGNLARAATDAAALLRSLANPDRLLLLCHLVEGECNVSTLESLTGIRQPSLSQQLGVLRDEGIVATRREGKFVYYRVASAPALAVLRTLHETFCAPAPRRHASARPSTEASS